MAVSSQASAPPLSAAEQREITKLSIDTIRVLAMDAVQRANAGHPGTAMALAPLAYTLFMRFLRVNPQDTQWPDRDRFVICSDGDLMEGVSQEAASIAGHFSLGKLIVCYDDNHITIDGTTAISFDGEDHCARLRADGWHVQQLEDSEDLEALEHALAAA